jgi:hypothetical protein
MTFSFHFTECIEKKNSNQTPGCSALVIVKPGNDPTVLPYDLETFHASCVDY